MIQPRLLGGRYELDGVVGRGGMAEVYRARDLRLDRIVAVKTLREDLARDPTFQARFRREAQSAASLNHPSIVAVYDTGEDNSGNSHVPFIVMEFVDGRTIRDLLRDDRRLLPERALEITDGVLRALDYSHRNGIVHRDIKPGNVMLSRSGEIKVMDFGIARAVADTQATMTQTAQVIGTAQYLSPEQARGERVDFRSDLYSVGCLLYELLTGRPPFTGDSPVAIAYQHVRENPVPPTRVDPELPAWADAIVLRAMAKSPADRYQAAADMRADIQRALSGFPVAPARPPAGYGPGPMQGTRRMDQMGQTQVQGPTGMMPPYEYGPPDDVDGQRGTGPRRRKRKVWPWVAAIVALLVIAVGIGVYQLISSAGSGIAIPQVQGDTLRQAVATLKSAGFVPVPVPSNKQGPANEVINTQPPYGSTAPKGSQVKVLFYKPADTVVIPSVSGLSLGSAQTKLTSAGLTVAQTTVKVVSNVTAGLAAGTTPSVGSEVKRGSTVTIEVSGGGVSVPYVVNLTLSQALSALQGQQLVPNVVTATPPNGGYGPGLVWKSTPAPGKLVLPNSTVTIYVTPSSPTPSPTPTSSSPSPPPSPSPSPSPSPTKSS